MRLDLTDLDLPSLVTDIACQKVLLFGGEVEDLV
jgi:hypothetical protein